MAPALQAVAVEAIDAVERSIDFICSDSPRRLTTSVIVRDAQVNMEIQRRLEREDLDGTFLRIDVQRFSRGNAIVEEVRATFKPPLDRVPFSSWRVRAATISRATSELKAVARYQDLRDTMRLLEESIGEMSFQLDVWLQEQSDIARGK